MTNSTATSPSGQPQVTGAARHLHEDGLIAIAWAGCGTAAFFLLLRLYARWREAARLFFDDYWMILAFTFLFCNAVLQTLQTPSLYYIMNISAGRIAVGPELLVQGNSYVRYEFVIIAFFWSTTWSVKGSFLALYYRLFDGLPQYRRMWWFAVLFSICAYIGCWMASVWTCHPPSTYFQFGQCSKPIDQRGSTISISYSTAVDIISDLMIMALPLRLLKDLQVTRQQKIGLAAVFTLGLLIVATAIVRMTQILGQARSDPVGLAVWGLVEASVAVIVGSLPPLKSFLAKKLQRYGTAGGYVYGGNGNYMPGSKGARGTGSAHLSTNKSASGKTESIPLEERDGSENSVSRLKDGHIVVTKSYGWERTESLGDNASTMHDPHDEEHGLVGVAVSDDLRSRHHSARIEDKQVVEGKTWLRTSITT